MDGLIKATDDLIRELKKAVDMLGECPPGHENHDLALSMRDSLAEITKFREDLS